MKYVGWQRVQNNGPMNPFLLVKALSSRSHHHKKRATNNDFSLHRLHHHHHPPHQPPTPPPAPCPGCDANASGDRSFGGRSNRHEDPLDPSPTRPSQLGPKAPINLYHHHRHSHHFPQTTPTPPESLPLRQMPCSPGI